MSSVCQHACVIAPNKIYPGKIVCSTISLSNEKWAHWPKSQVPSPLRLFPSLFLGGLGEPWLKDIQQWNRQTETLNKPLTWHWSMRRLLSKNLICCLFVEGEEWSLGIRLQLLVWHTLDRTDPMNEWGWTSMTFSLLHPSGKNDGEVIEDDWPCLPIILWTTHPDLIETDWD